MLVYLSVMVGSYIFTRMFTAAAKDYKDMSKGKAWFVQTLSLLTAIVAVICVGLIIIQGESIDIPSTLKF